MKVFVFGAGKVGTTLAQAAREAGVDVAAIPARKGWPAAVEADLVVLAVRDPRIGQSAQELAEAGCVATEAAVVHCAGSRGPELLAPLHALGHPVAQMHPLLAFASEASPPRLTGAALHLRGDPAAVTRAADFGRRLGMLPVELAGMDLTLYHASAALLANGAVGLAAAASQLLEAAGAPEDATGTLLGPLLRSVADNLQGLGLPAALTGPVRRGDVDAVRAHRDKLAADRPALVPLYDAAVSAQLDLARRLGEASETRFDAIAALVGADGPA